MTGCKSVVRIGHERYDVEKGEVSVSARRKKHGKNCIITDYIFTIVALQQHGALA
jgi:hypothetical protein